MKKDYQQLFRLFFMSFVLSSVTTFVCQAEEWREDGPVENIVGIYALRGIELLNISNIQQQPSATFNYHGSAANVWDSADTEPYSDETLNNPSNYTQAESVLSYFKKMGILLQLGGSYVNYSITEIFSGATEPPDFQKIFVMLGFDSILLPTLAIYREINNYLQLSSLLKISSAYEFNKSLSPEPSVIAGYSKREEIPFIPNYNGRTVPMTDNYNYDSFYDGTVSISLPFAVTESFSIIPTFTYAFPNSSDPRNDLRSKGIVSPFDKSSSFVFGGLCVSFIF